jgi:hypothetical protein
MARALGTNNPQVSQINILFVRPIPLRDISLCAFLCIALRDFAAPYSFVIISFRLLRFSLLLF